MDLPYYHGRLSKKDCEGLLLARRADGDFLLRDSESVPGVLCLCVSFNNLVYTYRIFQDKYGHYKIQTADSVPNQAFPSLQELVSKFRKPNQGLVFPLLNPVERAGPGLRWQSSKVDTEDDDDYENCSSEYIEVLP
ncbi:SH2 domain-containing protein 1B [Phyllostomus discolor]|uniref:SH2 domain-containing protein 1B n=1 Tax=Phyllostomus discolor TaxID=89673 RepID=A0A6J2L0N7_9CHIR|nr:SH2 domain-containing protein 1B [Phyllostomus discolor]